MKVQLKTAIPNKCFHTKLADEKEIAKEEYSHKTKRGESLILPPKYYLIVICTCVINQTIES